jgi:hypothetical protein
VLGAVMVAIALAPTIAPTTMAILMLLPLSAFEATAALPGAAVALTRARIAATQLRQLAAPAALTRTRPTLAPLNVRPGARIAIVGPSGCGKTTLLMITAEAKQRNRFDCWLLRRGCARLRDHAAGQPPGRPWRCAGLRAGRGAPTGWTWRVVGRAA